MRGDAKSSGTADGLAVVARERVEGGAGCSGGVGRLVVSRGEIFLGSNAALLSTAPMSRAALVSIAESHFFA